MTDLERKLTAYARGKLLARRFTDVLEALELVAEIRRAR